MPTGYTCDVEDGKITTLKDYALRCARAFGACIMQREDPMSDPPKHGEPSDYHVKNIESACAERNRLLRMSDSEAMAEAMREFNANMESHRQRMANHELQVSRYESMRSKVQAWNPPTSEHGGLKRFMLEQLSTGWPWDPSEMEPKPPVDGAAWRKARLEYAQHDIEYHTAEDKKERERVAGRNKWIDDLMASL